MTKYHAIITNEEGGERGDGDDADPDPSSNIRNSLQNRMQDELQVVFPDALKRVQIMNVPISSIPVTSTGRQAL